MPCSCNVTRVRISSIDAILLFDLPQFPPRPQQNLQVRDVRRHVMYRKQGALVTYSTYIHSEVVTYIDSVVVNACQR